MRFLKIWGNGAEKNREIDIKIDDWTDYAPDLSEFFGEDTDYFKEELNQKPRVKQHDAKEKEQKARDFEIDWNAVREREDWVDLAAPTQKATQRTPPMHKQAPPNTRNAIERNSSIAPPIRSENEFKAPLQQAEEIDGYDKEYAEFEMRSRKKHANKHKKSGKNSLKQAKKGQKARKNKANVDENTQKKRHTLRKIVIAVAVFAGLYATAVFSNIPFIEKWRTIYIETAMSTMNHQWLATAFLPPSVINKVVGEREALESGQEGITSNWDKVGTDFDKDNSETTPWKKLQKTFYEDYPEIDKASFDKYMDKNADEAIDENGFLMIDKAGLNDADTGIVTKGDDRVLAIDTQNGITIVRVTGEGYVGRLAIVKDPSRVGVALASNYGSSGSFATDIAKKRDAVLAINASGFFDPEGKGNGGIAHGVVISKGKKHNDVVGGTYKTIALDNKDRLNIGQYKSTSDFRDAVEFKPALIVDGKKLVKGSAGWGVQPRSAIGQTKNGTILMLIIDGRAPGYSIGATVGECANILERYEAVQACNLDGGSSSVMVYRGREISKPSAANKEKGRHIPNAFVVYEK